ncbi:MAG: GtrA family protein [Paludibacteraceae bacterium]|nr:GtrA family protein [Paludibacteraceae bacterium]
MEAASKEQLRETSFQLLRFAIVGVIATAVHYGVYLLLLNVFSETIAYSIGYVVAFVCNFILTCVFTFRKKATTQRGIGFGLAHLINYGLHVTLLNLFLWIGLSNKLAPIPVFCIAVPVNFLLVRYVFKRDR